MAQKSRTLAEEYIISIVPELDQKAFGIASKKVENKLKSLNKADSKKIKNRLNQEKEIAKTQREQERRTKNIASFMNTLDKGGKAFAKGFSLSVGKVALVLASLKLIYEAMTKITSEATKFSNRMISASSAFVDRSTRNTMAQFGVGSQTAAGIQAVTGVMGIDTSDMALMTQGQMQLYVKLMKQWQNGMNSINASDLEKFQDVMQNFQSELASAKLQMQLELYKMLVELGPSLEEFFDSIISLVKSFTRLLTSPVVKMAIQMFAKIVDFIASLVEVISFLFNPGSAFSSATTNNVSNSTSNVTVYNNQNNSFTGDNATMLSLANNVYKEQASYTDQVILGNGK